VKKAALTLVLLAAIVGALVLFVSKVKRLVPPAKMPPATQVLMEKLGQADRDLLHALYLVTNRATGAAASGLLTSDGIIVTDGHSVEGLRLQDLAVTSSTGEAVALKGLEVDRALDLGFLLSFSGIVTFPKAGPLRDVAAFVPADRLLVETDCPYLAPVPMRGKRNEPAWVVRTAAVLADVRRTTVDEIDRLVAANYSRLVGA
jgi:hypothetical protein